MNELMSSNSSQIISVSSKVITSSNDYHAVGLNTKIIYGNNSVLNGESHKIDSNGKRVKYSGFFIDSNEDIIIKNLTMQNFKNNVVCASRAKLDLMGLINFKNNVGYGYAGAIDANCGSSINFNGLAIVFKDNKTLSYNNYMTRGGAICINDATMNLNGLDVVFANNVAADNNGCGGAICVYGQSSAILGERVEFSDNMAWFNGGAIYMIHDSSMTIRGNVEFIGNNANSNGGAIYMLGGILNIETFNNTTSRFRENKAKSKSNAIHLADSALINFNNNGINAVMDMGDAITSEGSEATININGTGQFCLTSKEKSTIPNLNINKGSTFNLGPNVHLQITENLKVEKDARFNLGNNRENNIIYVKDCIQNGTLSFDIFADTTDTKYYRGDCIIVSGKVFLGADSKLEIFTNGIPISDRNERKYVLMTYGSLKGKFNKKNVIFMDTDLLEEDIDYDIEYKDNKIIFILNPKKQVLLSLLS
jgi:predicted outer membrane repeat protein